MTDGAEGSNIKRGRSIIKQILARVLSGKQLTKECKPYEDYYKRAMKQILEGEVTVVVPEYKGIFKFDVRSHILKRILRTGSYEDHYAELIKEYVDPSKDVLDIGANIGLYTILCSEILELDRKVLAAEPIPRALSILH